MDFQELDSKAHAINKKLYELGEENNEKKNSEEIKKLHLELNELRDKMSEYRFKRYYDHLPLSDMIMWDNLFRELDRLLKEPKVIKGIEDNTDFAYQGSYRRCMNIGEFVFHIIYYEHLDSFHIEMTRHQSPIVARFKRVFENHVNNYILKRYGTKKNRCDLLSICLKDHMLTDLISIIAMYL